MSLLGPAEEAVEGTQGDVLFVRHPSRGIPELATGQAHEPVEIPPPQLLGGLPVPVRQLAQPGGDRPFGCHLRGPPFRNAPILPTRATKSDPLGSRICPADRFYPAPVCSRTVHSRRTPRDSGPNPR